MEILVGSGPDNRVGSEAVHQLLEQFLQADQHHQPIIFKGSTPGRFFCPGFDLADLCARPEIEVARAFESLLHLTRAVFHSGNPVGVVAAGHAAGVGAILVLAADRTVMHQRAKFRFPEINLGLGLFFDVVELLRYRLPPHQAERFLREGVAFSAEDALAMGLVDALTPEKPSASDLDFSAFPAAPAHAARHMKALCRHGFLQTVSVADQVEQFMQCWTHPQTQALLRKAL